MDLSIQWGSGGGAQVAQSGERRTQEQEADGSPLSTERPGQTDAMSVTRGMELPLIQGWSVEVPTEERERWVWGAGVLHSHGEPVALATGRESWQRDGRELEANECSFPILGIPLVTSVGKDLPRSHGAQPLHPEFLASNAQNLGASVRTCLSMDCG